MYSFLKQNKYINNLLFGVFFLTIGVLGSLVYSQFVSPQNTASAAGNIYTVTSNADSGSGTLRDAITQANANTGIDIIAFNNSARNIVISSEIEIIDPVVINGIDSSQNPVCPSVLPSPVIISRDLTDSFNADFSGLKISSSNNIIAGLNIQNFGDIDNGINSGGILINSGTNNIIKCNLIGTNETGAQAKGNLYGVIIKSNQNIIGGSNPNDKNLISGNVYSGIQITGNNNIIENNYIGVTFDGNSALPNEKQGISVSGGFNQIRNNLISGNKNNGIKTDLNSTTEINLDIMGNTIGLNANKTAKVPNEQNGIYLEYAQKVKIGDGTIVNANTISGNGENGILLYNHLSASSISDPEYFYTLIQGNYIGTNQSLANGFGNAKNGIQVAGGQRYKIGGRNQNEGNKIFYNGEDGVNIQQREYVFYGGQIQNSNSSYGVINLNEFTGNGGIGIDLVSEESNNGITPNDVDDVDSGANNLQNYPVINSVVNNGSDLTVSGTLNSPGFNANVYIDIYANDVGTDTQKDREGKYYAGSVDVNYATNTPTINWSVNIPSTFVGMPLTVTATKHNPNNTGFPFFGGTSFENTSELGAENRKVNFEQTHNKINGASTGETVNVSLSYANTGTLIVNNAQLKTQIDPSLTFVAGSCSVSCNINGNELTWNIGNVPVSNTINTITYQVIVNSGVSYTTISKIPNKVEFLSDEVDYVDTRQIPIIDSTGNSQICVVSSNADTGINSFRECITSANTHAGKDRIYFNLPPSDPYIPQILNYSGMTVTDSVIIDGTTQNGWNDKRPNVLVRAYPLAGYNNTNSVFRHLEFNSSNNEIYGLRFLGNFPPQGTGLPYTSLRFDSVGGSNNNIIQGNEFVGGYASYSGVNNTHYAILFKNGINNLVGGSFAKDKNSFTALNYGIWVENNTDISIKGNYFGYDLGLKDKIFNDRYTEVAIKDSAIRIQTTNGVKIGGDGQYEKNYLLFGGVNFNANTHITDSSNIEIKSNCYGTDVSCNIGRYKVLGSAILLANLNNVEIGGSNENDRNIFVNTQNSIIRSNNVTGLKIKNNLLGTDNKGYEDNSCCFSGDYPLTITGSANVELGGAGQFEKNIIGTNAYSGIVVQTTNGLSIKGNLIGNNGQRKIGNLQQGIVLNFQSSPFQANSGIAIGGPNPGEGNTISGARRAIQSNEQTDVTIQGNKIGTDPTGSFKIGVGGVYSTVGANCITNPSAFSCDSYGINITNSLTASTPTNMKIGGSNSGEGNIISGSFGPAISTKKNTVVQGNKIGTDISGLVSINNNNTGILLNGDYNVIGGDTILKRNIISNNQYSGIYVYQGNKNAIQGNYIGLGSDGTLPLNNGTNGVRIFNGSNNLIGGVGTGEQNYIHNNGGQGIRVEGSTSLNNSILTNSTNNNTSIGINLVASGAIITPNDTGDSDIGPNNVQNYPVITSVTPGGTDIAVTGTLNTEANKKYRIELFVNDIGFDSTSDREGKEFVTAFDVTTDGTGNVNWNTTIPLTHINKGLATTATEYLDTPTSTVGTQIGGRYYLNTSEFGGYNVVVTSTPTATITKSHNKPTGAAPDELVTYTIPYANTGTATFNTATVTDVLDTNLVYEANTCAPNTGGITCSFNSTNNTITWNLGIVPTTGTGSSGNVTFQAKVKPTTPATTLSIGNTATITSTTPSFTATSTSVPLGVNHPPIGTPDVVSVPEEGNITIPVLTNDSDPNTPPSSLTICALSVTNPTHGTIIVNSNGTIKYTPTANYNGPDSFTYRACDPTNLQSLPIPVTITVTPVNDTPVANPDTATTPEDNPIAIPVLTNDIDIDNDPLVVCTTNGFTQPTHGTVAYGTGVDINKLVYTPTLNYNGTDSFTYKACDNNGGTSIPAVVNITVGNVNDLPVVTNYTKTTPEDTILPFTPTDWSTHYSDIDNGVLSKVRIISLPTNGVLKLNNVNITVNQEVLVADFGNITYTPTLNYNGADTFLWNGQDGNNYATNNASVDITVTPVNDIPVGTPDTIITPKDTPVEVPVLPNDTDIETPITGLTICVGSLSTPSHGTITINQNNTIQYTPTTGYNGTDSFTYKACDPDGGQSDPVPVTVTVENLLAINIDLYKNKQDNAIQVGQEVTVQATFKNPNAITLTEVISYIDIDTTKGDIVANSVTEGVISGDKFSRLLKGLETYAQANNIQIEIVSPSRIKVTITNMTPNEIKNIIFKIIPKTTGIGNIQGSTTITGTTISSTDTVAIPAIQITGQENTPNTTPVINILPRTGGQDKILIVTGVITGIILLWMVKESFYRDEE
jgi:parallel beta-helix repeat protein